MAHVLIVEARFYEDIANEMVKGAEAALKQAGVTWERIAVPGAFEIPAAVSLAAESGLFDGFVALGCVIRGETTHYDYVCQESARKLQDLAADAGLPIGYGILTCENDAQAWERAAVDRKNKGKDAVEACLAMIALRERFLSDDVEAGE
ncbi:MULTISPECIES: 6,7-dimethyl-8-ribityllumazine synthase [Limibacillus]|jgi:6,7-dimethyl-8-ribityllumazine synthase|uniref:6,7-dimethyl-8-ribityllumazine synthase n=1 Tax=Limibacillus halophilus TaxID=1579333 RepID=A0A839SW55_9PROT|nr:6,7-dimethyl-8-ribityllumazine synthase [Limibacillus halophilus]MBB3065736.1 6,7-dimethyl-8-ribityllumazine synthase [Limibacillus halophilus]